MVRPGLDRRDFLATVGRYAAGSCVGCGLAGLAGDVPAAPASPWTRQIDFYDQLPDRRIQCFVCPLNCMLSDGETCFCRTRTNVGGKLFTRAYDNPCIIRVDPIEKLPLHHFRPATQTLTLGVGGCNLRCLYCQNWRESQAKPDDLRTFKLTASEAVAAAKKKKIDTIAFSYTEPVAFLEWARDIAVCAKKEGLRVVVATAAFINPEPLLDFAQYVDAFVVALKGFTEELYHRVLGVNLEPVLRAIRTIRHETDCWLELVNLLVPGYNDSAVETAGLVRWVRDEVGEDVPLHFARFVPMYRLKDVPRTPVQTLEKARSMARESGLKYVYVANLSPHDGNNTYCPSCSCKVIERLGLKVMIDALRRGQCAGCRAKLPGVWR
jgi:pyruvate formate lyase activating enzyme